MNKNRHNLQHKCCKSIFWWIFLQTFPTCIQNFRICNKFLTYFFLFTIISLLSKKNSQFSIISKRYSQKSSLFNIIEMNWDYFKFLKSFIIHTSCITYHSITTIYTKILISITLNTIYAFT